MSPSSSGKKKTHKNKEKTVVCPVEGCEKEVLSRGLHLHIHRSSGGGHGERDEIPDDVNLEDAEEVGSREVSMDYPESRDSEKTARLCPYCERPFRGKNGVMIHLGQTAGRKNHPENPQELHDPSDFTIVRVDENENVIEKMDEDDAVMPSTERRQEGDGPDVDDIREYIQELREQGLDEQADRAEEMLLSD